MVEQHPSKRRKIQISEVSALLKESEWEPDISRNTTKDIPVCKVNQIDSKQLSSGCSLKDDFTEEEVVEETQIQASLPLYLDHIFGTHIGQSQVVFSASTQLCHEPLTQSPVLPLNAPATQSSYQDTALLDSQGFIKYTSYSRNIHISDHRKEEELCMHVNDPLIVVSGCSSQAVVIPESQSFVPCTKTATPLPVNATCPDSKSDFDSNSSPVLFHSPSSTLKQPDASKQVCFEPAQLEQEKNDTIATTTDISDKASPKIHRQRVRKRDLSRVRLSDGDSPGYVCPLMCTPLTKCNQVHSSVSVFAMILQVNPVMEVACKTGFKAGSTVPMSSLLLGDPTKAYFKLSLWREAAVWVERFSAGDIVLFKNIKLKTWLKEIVGTTMMHSSVLNFHQPKKPLPKKVTDIVSLEKSLDGLMEWARKYHGYLVSGSSTVPKSQRIVNFCTSNDFGTESVIHFRAKLLAVISNRVLLVADEPGREVHLYLLSIDTSLWSTQLCNGGVGGVWEFMFLAVSAESATQGGAYSLQTTSRSQRFSSASSSCSFVVRDCTISDVIARKSSGLFELKAKAVSAEFLFVDEPNLSLSILVQLEPQEMISQLCRAVYVGCESCSQPLKQDKSGIYQQCLACMIKKPGGYPSSSYYYSSMLFVLQDFSGSVRVAASHIVLPKVFGMSALEVVRASLAQDFHRCSELKKELQGALSTIQDSITNWTVSCVFTKDECSYVEEVSTILLDWPHPQCHDK